MKAEILFHGSSTKIDGDFLVPHKARDSSQEENAQMAVYATERKDIALGMALSSLPDTASFGNYEEEPYQSVFVEGEPKEGTIYLYEIPADTFEERPEGSHQWISLVKVKVLSVEEFDVAELQEYWRLATEKEKEWYYGMKEWGK